jgi:purine-binding chemotaxis protein CheW
MSDLFASRKVMRSYLNALLTEEQEPVTVQKQQLNKLLAEVKPAPEVQAPKVVAKPVAAAVPVQTKAAAPVAPKVTPAVPAVQKVVTPPPPVAVVTEKSYRQGKFQALFFEVAGLKVALPLKELGGIHQMGALNTLPGKPDWYKGVMLYRDQKINVVNTAMWVMPEKYDQALAEKLNYQYVIMLGKSSWGLACETLVNTVSLEQDDVKWRSSEGKRPWLAGLIKQHMCALLDVDALIALLAKGAASSD